MKKNLRFKSALSSYQILKLAPDIKLQQISKFSVFTIFTDFILIDPEK